MKHDAFSYDFTVKELIYFLFKKKICPKCGGEMTKEKGYQTVRGADLNSKADPFFVPNARVKQYQYYFDCRKCGARFTLNELSKRK